MGEEHHLNVHLGAGAHIVDLSQAAVRTPQVGGQIVRKHAELYIVGIALEGSETVEAYRTEINLARCLEVAVGLNLVDSGPGQRSNGAVSVDLAVVYIVVPETSEIRVAERRVTVAE